jgi:hypothetical protein
MKPKLQLKQFGRGWIVLLGTPAELKKNLGLPLAVFNECVNPSFYQSPAQARANAVILIKALRATGNYL